MTVTDMIIKLTGKFSQRAHFMRKVKLKMSRPAHSDPDCGTYSPSGRSIEWALRTMRCEIHKVNCK